MANKPVTKKIEGKSRIETIDWNGFSWIDINPPSEDSSSYLKERFPFHALDLDDTCSRIQRPKIDEYKEYLFMVFRFPRYRKQEQVLTASQVSVFIGEDYLITLHQGDLKPLTKLFRECQLEEEARQEYMTRGSGYLLYRILDRLVDYCLPILDKVGNSIEDLEDEIFTANNPNLVQEISRLRRDVIAFHRIIWPMKPVIGGLENKVRRFVKSDLAVYFGDMLDHVEKIWDGLCEYKEIVEGLSDTFNSLSSNRINEILRVLTILTVISAVLTVIVGFFGMNVPLPGGSDPGGSPIAWLGIIFSGILLTILMILFFRYKRWL
ncbi:MAG: magnesium transporter CorA family protein [Dehalococcoidales bacterium]|jgi:magnesium transporter|nr:magnesium transporter CorA family protein [Dehalococcoidales bacterium]MDX9986416.1 magnesium transporter CorA family protein [Dehalococcoidales bacterium]